MNYALRIEKIRKKMAAKNVDGLLIANDASWEYFTGLPRMGQGRTKARQNSLEYAGLLITPVKVTAFSPRLSALGYSGRMEDFPVVDELVIYQDIDLNGSTFDREIKAQKLAGKRLAVTRDLSPTLVLRLQEAHQATVIDMSADVDLLRAVKDDEEIALMREASLIADKIYYDILPMMRPGTPVREIEREVEILLESYGCSGPSFPAEVLHHGPKAGYGVGAGYYQQLERDHTIALDYGVVYKGYCSDFGRTIFLQEPTPAMVRAHELVMQSQAAGMAMMKAGVNTGADANAAAHQWMEDAGMGASFIHRLGHGIGKDVHERPFQAEGEDTVYQAGMCFTAEPSLYVPQEYLVRVEDVVLVTPTGTECLNKVTKDIVVLDR